jgi:Flp pilus assembly protein TadD
MAVAHSVIGKVLLGRGEFEEAASHLKACNRLAPSASTLTDYGGCLMYLGDNEEAEKAFRKAIGLEPEYALAHVNLGVVLASLGRTDEAVEEVRKASALDPNNPRTQEYLKELMERRK